MAKKTASLLPKTDRLLAELGERLRLARLRRKLTCKQMAERAGMSVMTYRSVERGGVGVTMGAYLSVMQVLGLEQDLSLIAKADDIGRQLQDVELQTPRKSSVRRKNMIPGSSVLPDVQNARPTSNSISERAYKDSDSAGNVSPNTLGKSGYASKLSSLIVKPGEPGKPRADKGSK